MSSNRRRTVVIRWHVWNALLAEQKRDVLRAAKESGYHVGGDSERGVVLTRAKAAVPTATDDPEVIPMTRSA